MNRKKLSLFASISLFFHVSIGQTLPQTGEKESEIAYSGKWFAIRASLAPGFASYSRTNPLFPEAPDSVHLQRNFNFSALAALSGDVRFGPHFAVRATVKQMLIRYKI